MASITRFDSGASGDDGDDDDHTQQKLQPASIPAPPTKTTDPNDTTAETTSSPHPPPPPTTTTNTTTTTTPAALVHSAKKKLMNLRRRSAAVPPINTSTATTRRRVNNPRNKKLNHNNNQDDLLDEDENEESDHDESGLNERGDQLDSSELSQESPQTPGGLHPLEQHKTSLVNHGTGKGKGKDNNNSRRRSMEIKASNLTRPIFSRKSQDYRQSGINNNKDGSGVGGGPGNDRPLTAGTLRAGGATASVLTSPTSVQSNDDRIRHMLMSVVGALKRNKKDNSATKGKNMNEKEKDAKNEEWNYLASMIPTFPVLGFHFLSEARGGPLSENDAADWNMNNMLTLIRVNILPVTITVAKKRNKLEKRMDSTLGHYHYLTGHHAKDKDKDRDGGGNKTDRDDEGEANESREKNKFVRIRIQYGDKLSWLVDRSLEDFANLYASYHRAIPEHSFLFKIEKLPKPPVAIRSTLSQLGAKLQDPWFSSHVEDPPTLYTESTKVPPSQTPSAQKGLDLGAGSSSAPRMQSVKEEPSPTSATTHMMQSPTTANADQTAAEMAREHNVATTSTASGEPSLNVKKTSSALQTYDAAPVLTRELEKFLRDMIFIAACFPDTDRMCKFLELSAMTLSSAADGGYQGKEGYLSVARRERRMDEGTITNAAKKVSRETFITRYFIIRDSFIIITKTHKNTIIQDVILMDSKFKIEKCPAHHLHQPYSFHITNSELNFRVRANTYHARRQFLESISIKMPKMWSQQQRFDSFAPVRHDVSAQWLVDGRDYFWNVCQAMTLAKETIFIHDWMLSPEVLMRRHERECKEWSLMSILKQKADEGVKIYIVLYREVNAAMHLASLRSKRILRELNPNNIWVQRHRPNLQATKWAHHEKLVVVDSIIAFIGGLDLCFGRWDTPEHSLIDTPQAFPDEQQTTTTWIGQDYSNPRLKDFYDLSRPFTDTIDRSENPRMPWHDVGLQILGQPSRDVGRHFIQRWNFLCRTKPKAVKIPFLLPKPDLSILALKNQGIEGTCEVQILRSVSSWSIGSKEPECSILSAYVASIERAEHFIYIENQFFITSTHINNVVMHNSIGKALTDRILVAHKAHKAFKVVVVLPLVPGFEGGINAPASKAVRMVMLCIYKSICHGKNSIYGRLADAGVVKPSHYISFYGLRNWAKLKTKFVTEQVYVHSKMMIVDDRVAIIGSANINERSMIGIRDSEIAAVIRDKDYIASTMNGEPFMVSRFAHTLRLNLMQEHLGVVAGGGHSHSHGQSNHQKRPDIDPLEFVDPVHPAFMTDIWDHHAINNTRIYHETFRCIPDNLVRTWKDYQEANDQSNINDPRVIQDFSWKQGLKNVIKHEQHVNSDDSSDDDEGTDLYDRDGYSSNGGGGGTGGDKGSSASANGQKQPLTQGLQSGQGTFLSDSDGDYKSLKPRMRLPKKMRNKLKGGGGSTVGQHPLAHQTTADGSDGGGGGGDATLEPLTSNTSSMTSNGGTIPNGNRTGLSPLADHNSSSTAGLNGGPRNSLERAVSFQTEAGQEGAMEQALGMIQGHLVEWPLDFLRDEIESNNFTYPQDSNHPLDLYT